MRKKVIIISWTFPPMPGIGGRRWVKFAKWMQRQDVDIHVFAVKNFKDTASIWNADLNEIRDRISYFRSPFATTLGDYARSLYERIRRRLVLAWLALRVEGNHYDRACLWASVLKKELDRKIELGYNNVIITAGPFHTTYQIGEYIRAKHPSVRVILDFRDPWTTNKTSFGIDLLSEKRLKQEKDLEKRALKAADYVVAVSEVMLDEFADHIGENRNAGKYHCIVNGFDYDDFQNIAIDQKVENLRLIFAGSLYSQSDYSFGLFADYVNQVVTNDRSLDGFQADFYGSIPDKFKLGLISSHVAYHQAIPLQKVYDEIANSQICMLFLTDDINYSLSTKFCEYIALGKPVVVFSNGGPTADFVESYGLGISIASANDFPKLTAILKGTWNYPGKVLDFEVNAFSVERLTADYLKLLQ